MAKDGFLPYAWAQGKGEETCQQGQLADSPEASREHLALSFAGSETRFFRAGRVKLIFRGMSLLKLPKRMQSIRKLAHGRTRKLVPPILGGMVGAQAFSTWKPKPSEEVIW